MEPLRTYRVKFARPGGWEGHSDITNVTVDFSEVNGPFVFFIDAYGETQLAIPTTDVISVARLLDVPES